MRRGPLTKREAKAVVESILDDTLMGSRVTPDVTKNYKRYRQFDPKLCARGSFRMIERGKIKLVVCCPRGQWQPRKKRCRVGTKAQSILKPRGR